MSDELLLKLCASKINIQFLKHLSLKGCENILNKSIAILCQTENLNLTGLNLCHTYIDEDSLINIAYSNVFF